MHIGPLITLDANETWGIVAALVLMAFDILSGLICAAIRRDFQSSKMREGIAHKAVILLVVIMAVLVQGFAEHVPDLNITVPLVLPVCVYVVLMEIASFLETVRDTYPDLADSAIFRLFQTGHKGE